MLDAAVRVFSRRGFHAASMDEIADDAGISKPMVYAYLGAKEEVFIACLHREGTRLMEAIAAVVDPDLPPDEQLWRGLRAFFGFVGAHRDGWAVLYRQARGEQPFAGQLAQMRTRMVEVVAGMLGRATAAEGREVPATELDVMAYALVGATESLADWLADHPEADPERTATRMMNVAWLGAAELLRGNTWHPSG
ncbi:TetR/AcrR family transcriptional regulator [Micromonospora zhanjiangensis]